MADNTNEPMTDDAELAKVLEGMQNPANQATQTTSGIAFEPTIPTPATPVPDSALPPVMPDAGVMPAPDSTPVADPTAVPAADTVASVAGDPTAVASETSAPEPVAAPDMTMTAPPVDQPMVAPLAEDPMAPAPMATDQPLEAIKKDALTQLRPLVDKLELPPEEKFDTLLLIIRSTDDKSLVQTTYDAARNIPDEAKRAEALLDVVKEIDYFSNPAGGQPQL